MTKEDLEQLSVYEADKEIKTYLINLYTRRPEEPKLKNVTPTEDELSNFLAEKRKYQKLLKKYEVNNDFYKSESTRLHSLLDDLIREDSGLNDIPEQYRDKVYSYAYQQGHSGGYIEVYNYLLDLVEIFK